MSGNPHSVACPYCGAKAGEKCQSYAGTVFQVVVHWKRKALAASSDA